MIGFGWSSCGRKLECPEKIHLSDLVTTWPSHMPTSGIEPGSQRWEASALTLRQPYSLYTSGSRVIISFHANNAVSCVIMYTAIVLCRSNSIYEQIISIFVWCPNAPIWIRDECKNYFPQNEYFCISNLVIC